jgi:hypothetical protein
MGAENFCSALDFPRSGDAESRRHHQKAVIFTANVTD